MQRLFFALTLAAVPLTAAAESWTCRNEAAEIACTAEGCAVAESFTPMSVSLDDAGGMALCAYSGCWEGRASGLLRADGFLAATSGDLRWSGAPDAPGVPGALLLDIAGATALVRVADFAHPLTCQAE